MAGLINTRMVAPERMQGKTIDVAPERKTGKTIDVAPERKTGKTIDVAPQPGKYDSIFEVSQAQQDLARLGRDLQQIGTDLLGQSGMAQLAKEAPGLFKALGFTSADGTQGPVPPPGTPPQLTQHGGAVLNAPVVSNIYVGNYWGSAQGQADIQHNDGFVQGLASTGFQNIAAQYGAAAPTFGGSTVVNQADPQTITEADVQSIVKQQIAAGAVQPNAQGIYNVVLPPGTILDAGGGVTSQNGLGGFHGSYADTNGNPVYYSVEAYSQGNNGIDFNGNAQDNISITESHEFMEAVTDPDVNSTVPGRGLGWYDDQDNGEIGDLAIAQLPLNQVWGRDSNGYAQQLEWSNNDGAFELDSQSANPPSGNQSTPSSPASVDGQ